MSILTDEQVSWIEQRLDEHKICNQILRQEVLDHVCCAVEAHLQQGLPFETAYACVMTSFGENGLQQLDKQTLKAVQSRPHLIRKLSGVSGAIAACLFLIVMVGNATERPDIQPLPYASAYARETSSLPVEHPHVKRSATGVYFQVSTGTPVLATAGGIVYEVTKAYPPNGLYVVIRHNDEYMTMYSYLESVRVKEGQEIEKGQIIGLSGKNGQTPELYYEIIRNGQQVNPLNYF
jgi:biotin carboxyl carrier protein